MKKYFVFLLIASTGWMMACNKTTTLPPYTPPVTANFSVQSLVHTVDSVNVGDTIYLNATGTVYDTTQAIYVYLVSTYTAGGVSSVYDYGTSTTPFKVSRVIGANTNGLYGWTATIWLIGATEVPHKTKLSITGNFSYQLDLSSELGNLSASDAGKNKSVYVK